MKIFTTTDYEMNRYYCYDSLKNIPEDWNTKISEKVINLNSREKFEPGPGFEPRTSRSLAWHPTFYYFNNFSNFQVPDFPFFHLFSVPCQKSTSVDNKLLNTQGVSNIQFSYSI